MFPAKLLILLSLVAFAAAENGTGFNVTCSDGEQPQGTLIVTGIGSIIATPDEGEVILRVEVTRQNATVARQDAAVAANATLAVLSPLVPAEDIKTLSISLAPMYNYEPTTNAQSIAGYTFSQTISVKVSNLTDGAAFGQVVDQVVEAGGNDVQVQSSSIQLSRETQQASMDEARKLAVERAINTARILAEAAGLSQGPVMSLTDSNYSPPQPLPMPIAEMATGMADAKLETPIQLGTQNVDATVSMQFALCRTPAATASTATATTIFP